MNKIFPMNSTSKKKIILVGDRVLIRHDTLAELGL